MRFYNLKSGSKKVNGGVLEVNFSADLENRVKRQETIESDWGIKFLRGVKEGIIYKLTIPRGEYVSAVKRDFKGTIKVPLKLPDGEPDVIWLILTPDEGLSINNNAPKGKKVYITEISQKKAKRMQEEADNFAMLRAYIFE